MNRDETLPRITALLVAGGRSERMAGETPKQFQMFEGRMLIEYALQVLLASPRLLRTVVVVPASWEGPFRQVLTTLGCEERIGAVVVGGATRQESVWRGLQACSECTHVLVHDAARPFLSEQQIQQVTDAMARTGAATIATLVSDTLMRAHAVGESSAVDTGTDRFASEVVDRRGVWAVQTPQAFELPLLLEAHDKAKRDGFVATDDGTLVLRLGHPLELVPGAWWNLKVTCEDDWDRARLITSMRKSRSGKDRH